MAQINVGRLASDMQKVATQIIGKDVSTLRGFTKQQLAAIAQQAALVAAGIADGSIAKDTQDFFLDSLEEMARSFVNTLAGLVSVIAEQVWNALVKVLWEAIGKATGISLVVP
ncbi:hypothetical protein [Rhizobium ruizarguesonis]|uniref:hypothetical protein n=1 Tax=Rhizobium ruizarguesonis TaxID=2081791 RepID=UPI001030D1A0|nr:hypothetical protein [Rhizobium ruizarguesonis]TBA72901.1 hypothetical protein ELH56_35175 [Rhizobium ruizarguesonis]WSH62380.1 hypothetical protein U8P68_37990 [Rhizobium ruizarguesonis]